MALGSQAITGHYVEKSYSSLQFPNIAIVSGLCDLGHVKRTSVQRYLAEIGRKGGLRSRRKLDPETARRMVALREARRAYRTYYHTCFWSYQPNAVIQTKDIPWVVAGLKKEGDRDAYEWARRIASLAADRAPSLDSSN